MRVSPHRDGGGTSCPLSFPAWWSPVEAAWQGSRGQVVPAVPRVRLADQATEGAGSRSCLRKVGSTPRPCLVV